MKFKLNKRRKKQIERKLMKEPGTARGIAIVANLVLVGGILVAGCILGINLLDSDLHMKTVDGVLQKDYLTIAEHFLTTLSLSVILFVVLRVFAHGLGTRDVSGRVDERLILQDDKLFYIFRTRFVTTSGGANVIMIPFKKIRDVIYYEKTSEILLLGDFMGDTFAFFSDDCPVDPSSVHLSEIAIYDYFEPDVYPIILEATNGNAGSPQIGCSVCEEVSTENG